MSIPVATHGDSLYVSVQNALDDRQWEQLADNLMTKAANTQVDAALVDLSGVDVMDSFAVRMFTDLAHTLALQGIHTVAVGIGPDVAYTMVRLGLTLDDVHTALDYDAGMQLIEQLREGPSVDGR